MLCAGELYVHNKEQQITMNANVANNLEKLVQRLETATLRLEALGAQKPMLAPKPIRNGTPPLTVACKLELIMFSAFYAAYLIRISLSL
uniref:Uncharacterized protein n=1 Tax=Onchocerca volvulus TaxID=6282 RepID=A0A8R1TRA5_ONCVO